jgi:excisionase family DNA binding protein
MTLTEAGKRLGLNPETLRIQIGKGKMRAERHGRDWWVTPAEVERYRAESLGRPGRKVKA